MTHTKMLEAYPKDLGGVDRDKLAACIEACFECAQTCTACADACLSEDMVAELTKCIRTNLDCADICATTGRALSRHTGYDANLTRAFLVPRSLRHRLQGLWRRVRQPRPRALPDLRRGLPPLRAGVP